MNSSISSIFNILTAALLFLIFSVKAQTVDSASRYRVNSVQLIGNKKTKDKIVLRELIKKEGDTLTLRNYEYIKRRGEFNIFNTQLFIYDSIQSKINDSSKTIDYTIKMKERWYIWPIPFVDYLDRNINSWWKTKDPGRLAYSMQLYLDNFSGVKDRLMLQFRTGYANQLLVNYRLPYLNEKQTLGAYVQYAFNEFNKLSYATLNNTQQFVVDDADHLRTDNSIRAGFFLRPRLFEYHAFDIGSYRVRISDHLRSLNEFYLKEPSNTMNYISVSYRGTFDNRDNKIYPLNGTVLDIIVSKDGLDISDDSPLDYAQTILTYKQFIPLHPKFNVASLWRGRLVNTEQRVPYIYNQALGYSNFIRGYEYNVIDGQNYFLTKNSIRYQLIKPKFHEVGALKKMKAFSTIPFYAYLNAFVDAGYVQEKHYTSTNTMTNSWQLGYGVGLDLITYYDFVMRLEYSFNKQKQSGFYIHFASGF